MSLFTRAVHIAAQPVGWAAKGVGTAYDYATPGKGSSSLTNVGNGITNPGVNGAAVLAYGVKDPATQAPYTGQHTLMPNADQPTANAGVTSTYGGGYAAPAGPSAAQLAANQQAASIANSALGRLPGQLQTALGQVQNTYNQNNNELNSSKAAAQNSYGQSTAQNQQQFVGNKNQINNQASSGLRSLLALLGQHGAGASSAAQYAAPDAVAQVANQQRSGAGQTYGQNQQALDTNWGNFQTGFDNSQRKLHDWLSQQQNSARSNSEQQRQALLEQLANLQSSPEAAQPYIDQINASAGRVDELAKFNPTYTGTTPVYNAPNVQSYTVDQTGNPTLGAPDNGTGASTPVLNFLLGLNRDQQQNQMAF